MALKPLKITFQMDGRGVMMNTYEPITLDGILSRELLPFHKPKSEWTEEEKENDKDNDQSKGVVFDKGLKPFEVPLPLGKWHMNGEWGWHASALFPDDDADNSTLFWRKRFRANRIESANGNPNTQNSTYRDYNTGCELILTNTLTCHALGDRGRVAQILRRVKNIGKKHSVGVGLVIGVEVEVIEEDFSLFKDGKAMRYLPTDEGFSFRRMRPPYFSSYGAVTSGEIGDDISIFIKNS